LGVGGRSSKVGEVRNKGWTLSQGKGPKGSYEGIGDQNAVCGDLLKTKDPEVTHESPGEKGKCGQS